MKVRKRVGFSANLLLVILMLGGWVSPLFAEPAASEKTLTYPLDAVIARDAWRLGARGNGGVSAWDGKRLALDYSQGASQVQLYFPDVSLPGAIRKIRVVARGNAAGHPVSLHLRTHFMTFSKTLGEFKGEGEQVLETEGPPSAGWTWKYGENDGKIHGPLRPAELCFEAGDAKGKTELEIVAIQFEAAAPADRQAILTVQCDQAAQPARFGAQLRAFSDQPLRGTLCWELKRWDGTVLQKDQREVEVPAGLQPRLEWVNLPSVPEGCRFVEAEFVFKAAGQKELPVQAYWMGPCEINKDLSLDPDSPFGMGVYLNRFDPQTMERIAQLAGKAGVKWSREDFSWSRIEPQPGQYQWDFYDRLVETANRNGISVYAIVGYWTGWSKDYTPEGIQQYTQFLRALVRRYRDRIHQWEIWNEPNIFFWQGPKELYADLLIESYRVVKEEDPTAQVLGLSTAGIDFDFIDKMLKKKTPFDVLTIHPYRKELKDAEFIADLKKAADVVKLPDGTKRPVWITEMGWATFVPHHVLEQDFAPNSQRAQANYLARTYLGTIASGVQPKTFWYNFSNDGDDPFYFEHNMGIMQRDGRPKPAYAVYAAMTSVLKGQRFVRQRDDLGNVFAAEFESKDGKTPGVLALWSAEKDATVAVPATGEKAVLVNAIGEQRPLQIKEGRVEIDLKTGAPVYLLLGSE